MKNTKSNKQYDMITRHLFIRRFTAVCIHTEIESVIKTGTLL